MHPKIEKGKIGVPSTKTIRSERRHSENRFPINACHAKQKECQYEEHTQNVPQNKYVHEDVALADRREQRVHEIVQHLKG